MNQENNSNGCMNDNVNQQPSKKLWGSLLGLGTCLTTIGIIWYKKKKAHTQRNQRPKKKFTPNSKPVQEHALKTRPKKKRHSNVTPALVDEWKRLAKEGVSRPEIAQSYDVSLNTVNNHLKQRTYERTRQHE